ncbi:hypothetical protein ACROYT_G009063 [Oculina patagonica]
MTTLLERGIDDSIATGQRVSGRVTRHSFRDDSGVAALLSMGNVIGQLWRLCTWQSGATDMDRHYLTKAATVGLWIIRKPTTLELCWKWSARYSSGNDTIAAALLGLRNVEGSSTTQFGTRNLDGYYLTIATSVGLWIIRKCTTLTRRREWIARRQFGKDSVVATLLGMRNVKSLSTRQSGARSLQGYNLVEAASVGLWIIG